MWLFCKLQTCRIGYLDIINRSFPNGLGQFSGGRVVSDERREENNRRTIRMLMEDTKCADTAEEKEGFTYEELSFLLLILSTSTVMVMPMSTPAASNKAITLMTSPVAIWGRGLSAVQTHIMQEKNGSIIFNLLFTRFHLIGFLLEF